MVPALNVNFAIFNHHDPGVVHQNINIPNLIPNLPKLKGESDLRKWKSQRKLSSWARLLCHLCHLFTFTHVTLEPPGYASSLLKSTVGLRVFLQSILEAIDYDHQKNYHCNYFCYLYVFDSGLVGLPINIDGNHEAAERGKAESQLPKKFNIVTTLILIIMKNQLLLKKVTTLILIPMKTGNCWKWAVTCPYHDQLLSPGQCPQPPPWYFLILIVHLPDIT